MKLGMHNIVTL